MIARRTDIAAEACQLWRESAGDKSKLPGVIAGTERRRGFGLERVEIVNDRGARALGKPQGRYISIDTGPLGAGAREQLSRCACLLAELLGELLKLGERETVLVCGLGNSAIAPDNIGPAAAKKIIATRHLREILPKEFGGVRPVAVLEPGVLGTTGVESAEIVRAVAEKVKPGAIIAIDALAARNMERLCRSLQLSDSGIVPGSGVGNARCELSKNTLGVPVIALGVPTVVDAATLAADLMEQAGVESEGGIFGEIAGQMVVTPREIEGQVGECAHLIACGVNMALQGLSFEEAVKLM